MLALYHLVNNQGKLAHMSGAAEVLAGAGVAKLPKIKVAVLVGTDLNATAPHLAAGGSGIEVRTLWGEMAAQLGGKSAYDLVRPADLAGVEPGVSHTDQAV